MIPLFGPFSTVSTDAWLRTKASADIRTILYFYHSDVWKFPILLNAGSEYDELKLTFLFSYWYLKNQHKI